MADSSTDLARALSRYLTARRGAEMTVSQLEHLSLGWESDVYRFGVDAWDDGAPRVLRLYFGGGAARAAVREYQALRLLADAGYPVPAVDLVEPSPGPLGRVFLVMQRIAGEPMWETVPKLPPEAQDEALTDLGVLQAQLHQIDLDRLPSSWPVRVLDVQGQLDSMTKMSGSVTLPDLDLAWTWLQAHLPVHEPPQLGLVHWDYHPNNVLQDADGRRWVIDWTQFQATDVRFDLTWTLLLVGAHAGQRWADALIGRVYGSLAHAAVLVGRSELLRGGGLCQAGAVGRHLVGRGAGPGGDAARCRGCHAGAVAGYRRHVSALVGADRRFVAGNRASLGRLSLR